MSHVFDLRRVVLRAVLVSFCLAGARAVLAAMRYELSWRDPASLGFRVALDKFWIGLAIALPAALLCSWILERPRRQRADRGTRFLTGAAVLLFGYLFVAFRLPSDPLYTPELESSRGVAANVAAGLCAAAATAFVFLHRGARTLGLTATIGILLIGAGSLFVGGAHSQARWPERPNVILISLDTLRPDHLGCYGYGRETSPEIDRFAAKAMRFDQAHTHEAWTLTAHMSMLTALPPSVHGVDEDHGLRSGVPSLATAFQGANYSTLAVVDSCVWLHPKYGFDRGFEVYRRVPGPAQDKVDEILSLLDASSRPVFLFAHFFDAHSDFTELPYEAGPEDLELLAGWYQGAFDGCGPDGHCASRLLKALNERGETLGEEELRYVESLYDAGIRTMDRELGRFFDALVERGFFENTVILLTGDHGEEFSEHGRLLHSQNFSECLRVPFLLRTPDTEGGSSAEPVGLIDVMPTLLELAGLARDEATTDLGSRSLAPLLREPGLSLERPNLVADSRGEVVALRSGRWSLVRSEEGWHVFDVREDPLQLKDLRKEIPPEEYEALMEKVAQETQKLSESRRRFGPEATVAPMGEGELEQIRALGY